MAIEIVDFPIKNGDFPWLWDSLPEGIFRQLAILGLLKRWIWLLKF
jgi:hypothetical protein